MNYDKPGNCTTYSYDNANRLTSLYNRKSDNSVISSFDYLVDRAGNRTKMTLDGGDYVEYIYDGKYQLTSEARSGGTSYTRAFYYDPVGNRTRLVKDGPVTVTYAYDIADKLTKETEGETETTYLYDANGSLTRKTQGETVEAYGYNYDNLMSSYDGPGTDNDTTYTYDIGLKRIKKDVDGTVTKFIYHGPNVVADYDGSNTLQASYITPGLDQNLTIKRSGSTYYYHQDGLGSIRNITDASENIQNTYDYYAFGSVVGTPTENVANDYRFTGRRYDSESALHYYRLRYYHGKSGRFTTSDRFYIYLVMRKNNRRRAAEALRSVLLRYIYVGSNPLNARDSFGKAGQPDHINIPDWAFEEVYGVETGGWHNEAGREGVGSWGEWANAYDDDYNPHNPFHTERHFRDPDDVSDALNNAIDNSDPEAFRDGLHELEDSIVHGDEWWRPVQHVVCSLLDWTGLCQDPDRPHWDPEKGPLDEIGEQMQDKVLDAVKRWDQENCWNGEEWVPRD